MSMMIPSGNQNPLEPVVMDEAGAIHYADGTVAYPMTAFFDARETSAGLGDDILTQTRPRRVLNTETSIWDRITPIIGAGFNVLNTWLLTRPGANPYAVAQQPNGVVLQQQLTPAQLQQLAAASQQQQQELVSAGANEGGLRIGNSVISWPVIMVGVVALFLIQSSGFSRR